MKKFVRLPILTILIFTYFSCSKNPNNDLEINQAELIESLKEHLSNFNENSIDNFNNKTIINELDHFKNYEESIFNLITNKIDKKNIPDVYNNELGYSNPNEFDKYFVKFLVDDLQSDNFQTFIKRSSHYQIFINSKISSLAHKEYLNNMVEQFKWIKYGVYTVFNSKTTSENSRDYNEGCFDDCMEDAIEDQFDWWGGWVEFVLAPGPVVAWMAGECIYDCHFAS
jgi:hypothetical protein